MAIFQKQKHDFKTLKSRILKNRKVVGFCKGVSPWFW